ncbi:MAG: Na/Pi cotransporter family protein [Oscillospiraceae bacterium]|nr:Na/Pi cotransporter family protein [Oscillospiraceae bacterium]MBQ9148530.1 Na/Pi cotransporter family protein [Oscillospiraceae bacterium]
MDIFDILTMIGGLCLFLFGMNVMGESLERAAGNSLRTLLSKLTGNRLAGFLTGLAVTAVIQSSSATTVMVVGFVNSGLLSLSQAIGVIMGANVGTTVTAWILSLGGIDGDGLFMQLLKPSSFTPVLALLGTVYYMFLKDGKKKDIGMILLGFAVLMFGMDTMSGAVKGLQNEAWFTDLFLLFKNPILGVLAGALLTGIIQSSSASVGILQALSATGAVSFGASIPIIMGQNIGTTVTALLSSVGTNKNARRAAVVHMMFNVIGTVICLIIFVLVDWIFAPAILDQPTDYLGISICHTAFNVVCTSVLLPSGKLLEKIACKMVPDAKTEETNAELDERLLVTPAIALESCRETAGKMVAASADTFRQGVASLKAYTPDLSEKVRELENLTDHYEDILGSYLVKLSALRSSEADSNEATMLLKAINDFERIADHGMNLMEAAQEMDEKNLEFSKPAKGELNVLVGAVNEIIDLSFKAFLERDLDAAYHVEPLEEVIDHLKEQMRTRHILRMQQGNCSIEAGFVWSDLLTSLERVSDHCSNIAGCIIDLNNHNLSTHEAIRSAKMDYSDFGEVYSAYAEKYHLA